MASDEGPRDPAREPREAAAPAGDAAAVDDRTRRARPARTTDEPARATAAAEAGAEGAEGAETRAGADARAGFDGFDGDTLPVADVDGDGEVATMFRTGAFRDRYQRGELLGHGGMGDVHALADRATGRVVAMKTIRREREADGLRRFAREARIQAQLEHPSIVPVYDVGVAADGAMYFTMKRVRGDSLGTVLTRLRGGDAATAARYKLRKLLAVVSSVAMTIEYAHRRGVVHRDLKPSNVMLGGFGEVYVLDWGLADLRAAAPAPAAPLAASPSRAAIALPDLDVPMVDSSLRPRTETGDVLGTPGYAAPEQIASPTTVDHRSDVYALGVMLFEVLALERLHVGATVPEVFASTLDLDGAHPRARAPGRDIPPELDAIVHAATRRDPAARTQRAGDLARAIDAYLDGDRDLEARRRLAAQSATAAAAALTSTRTGGVDEVAARALALREVTAALGLDPGNAQARALLVQLLTEPGPGTERAAEEAHRAAATASYRLAARNAIYALCTYILYVPIVVWMGVRHWWMLGAMAGGITATIGVTYYYYRRPPRDLRLPLPHLAMSTAAMACGVVMFGPLVLLPAIVIANGVAYAASMRHRGGAVVAATLAVVLVPLAAQVAGVVPPWYEFDGGGLRIVPWMTEFPPAATLTFLAVTHVVVIAACLWFVAHLRAAYLEAERRLRVQAWQLSQIVPAEARGAAGAPADQSSPPPPASPASPPPS